jgi:Gas vesicle protein K
VAKRKTARTRPPAARRAVKRPARRPAVRASSRRPAVDVQEIESLRTEIARVAKGAGVPRWNADPKDVRRSVMKLVLTLVELIRQLLERQAIRRLEAGSLSPKETEAVGLALMRLEETVRDLALQFDLDPAELNFDLGPVGKLI